MRLEVASRPCWRKLVANVVWKKVFEGRELRQRVPRAVDSHWTNLLDPPLYLLRRGAPYCQEHARQIACRDAINCPECCPGLASAAREACRFSSSTIVSIQKALCFLDLCLSTPKLSKSTSLTTPRLALHAPSSVDRLKMKFLLLLLAAGSMALQPGTPTKRDVATISSAVAYISGAVSTLEAGVKSFSGTPDVGPLETESDTVISALQSGASRISQTANLTQDEALSLTSQIMDLSTLVNSTVQAVIDKKSDFTAAGVGPVVYTTLQNQLKAAQGFADAIISKVPAALHSTSEALAQPIFNDLNNGIAAFSDQVGASTTGTPSTTDPTPTSSISTAFTSLSATNAAAPTDAVRYGAAVLAAAAAVVAAM